MPPDCLLLNYYVKRHSQIFYNFFTQINLRIDILKNIEKKKKIV